MNVVFGKCKRDESNWPYISEIGERIDLNSVGLLHYYLTLKQNKNMFNIPSFKTQCELWLHRIYSAKKE